MTNLPVVVAATALAFLSGCGPSPKPTKDVVDLKDIQGRWYVIQVVGPDGKGFETTDVYITVKDNVAVQGIAGSPEESQLRLEFNSDGSYLKLFAKTDAGEKLVGEVKVTLTTAEPVQMLWADRASNAETLMEKVDE